MNAQCIHEIWSYKERWDFSISEGSLIFGSSSLGKLFSLFRYFLSILFQCSLFHLCSYSFFYVEIYSTNAYKNFQKVHIIPYRSVLYDYHEKYIISLYSAKKKYVYLHRCSKMTWSFFRNLQFLPVSFISPFCVYVPNQVHANICK